MKFTIRDENGMPLYQGSMPLEWPRTDIRLAEFKVDPCVYTPFFVLVIEPDTPPDTPS